MCAFNGLLATVAGGADGSGVCPLAEPAIASTSSGPTTMLRRRTARTLNMLEVRRLAMQRLIQTQGFIRIVDTHLGHPIDHPQHAEREHERPDRRKERGA